MRSRVLLFVVVALLAGGAAIGYWLLTRGEVSTDNAYVNADVAQIAALVTGPVTKVYIKDNQFVKKGERLFDIDPRPFEVAVAKAEANLAQAERGARQDGTDVAAAKADVARARAALENDEVQLKRAEDLVARKFLSRQSADDALAKVRTERAALEAAEARLEHAEVKARGGVADSPDVRAARAVLAQAKLDLSHTVVDAPDDGWVSNMTLAAGTIVTADNPLFALVRAHSFWIDANFKETELHGIRPGEKVDIAVDMYPGRAFRGVVQSLSQGTGTAFSLLPPQNATGNWVKVTQRVPVKVAIDDYDPKYPLRIGATATVTVHLD
ncbi:MAG: efflux RND transporter periplasmic adaptor subunit [Sphingomonadaceae bacterium]